MKFNKKTIGIGAGTLVLIILIGALTWGRLFPSKPETQNILQNEAAIPTVDSSVQVELKPVKRVGDRIAEVSLTIKNPPKGTKKIEFEITYSAYGRGDEEGATGLLQQGAVGKCVEEIESGIWTCQQQKNKEAIVLGTCSSGTCVYDRVVGPIRISIKFTGNYGARIFEKEYKF